MEEETGRSGSISILSLLVLKPLGIGGFFIVVILMFNVHWNEYSNNIK